MKLTAKKLNDFFGADTFVKFVGKKYGWFCKNDDDLAEVRFFSIRACMRAVDKEFEDDKHLYGFVEKCVANAYLSMLNDKQLQKNNLPIANESELTYGDGEESFSLYEIYAVSDSPEYDNKMEYLYKVMDNVLSQDEREFFSLRMQGKTYQEIGDVMYCSGECSRTTLLRIVNKLKPFFDADKRPLCTDVPRVQKVNRNRPEPKYETSSSRRLAASNFLNL